MCPTMCCRQVPKATKAPLAHLGPQALRALLGPLEAEEPRALDSQTHSTASAQVRRAPYPTMTPWREKLMRKSVNSTPHKQNP